MAEEVLEDFELEPTTVWSFPKRGKWATHSSTATYRGNFAPQVPRNLILRYSKKGDVVLDPFVGSGTTLIECRLLDRIGIGVDINPTAVEICKKNLNFKIEEKLPQLVKVGDARHIDFLKDESVDLVIAHPPYADIIRYSNIKGDLSQFQDIKSYVKEMKNVAEELFRVLRHGGCCAIVIGDIRRNKRTVPLGFNVFGIFQKACFLSQDIIVKLQHNCKRTNYWLRNPQNDFLLLAHEYIFVLEKV